MSQRRIDMTDVAFEAVDISGPTAGRFAMIDWLGSDARLEGGNLRIVVGDGAKDDGRSAYLSADEARALGKWLCRRTAPKPIQAFRHLFGIDDKAAAP